ncbi:MAG: PD-(D/E)XK nuclease family protein [Verrucomicrobiota bacterium]
MSRTNNFSAPTPRQIHLGAFQPTLEAALAARLQARRPLAPVTVIVPTHLLGLALRRKLAPHVNVDFQTLNDLMRPATVPPPLALELLCRQLAHALPADGYFAPVSHTTGFATALRNTFTDLQEAGLTKLAGTTPKLRELAAAYTTYRAWLAEHNFLNPEPRTQNCELFLYGFYDLNATQKQFIAALAPSAIFFPATEHDDYSQPLLAWFKSLGYQVVSPAPPFTVSPPQVVSCPGETAEVREAVRAIFAYLRANPGKTFNDCAILCRSRDQYDAILRDTLPQLGIRAFFRGGRPLTEQHDAKLLLLLLAAIRSDFSRAAVMELACHIGPNSHWDAQTVRLGIVSGKSQWHDRLQGDESLRRFIDDLFAATEALPRHNTWRELVTTTLNAFRQLGGTHAKVIGAIEALTELDALELPVDLPLFTEFSQKALEAATDQTERFQAGNVFVSDVMGARGLSFDFVVLLGLVEKSFPRVIREDPLLLDDERQQLSAALPLKRHGHDEERLLFDLTCRVARDQLILSFPRLDAGTARPRVPSSLLLEATGATDFKSMPCQVVPLAAFRDDVEAVDEREFDLVALHHAADRDQYLAQTLPVVAGGVAAEKTRWRESRLTRYDGVIADPAALKLLRDRFGLEKLVISATSLEKFFQCPFAYFQQHVLGVEKWEEPEATIVIDALDLGSLYHAILEDYYRRGTLAVIDEQFQEFARTGVTGYPTVWEIKKEIIRHEVTAFVAREQRRLSDEWQPREFEKEFKDLVVAPPVRLRGKIDRIDFSTTGHHARVLDYKAGKLPRGLKNNSLAAGETLQLPLYLLAAEQLLPGVTVDDASYLYFTMRGGYRAVKFSHAALDDRRAELTGLLQTASDMIRDGVFAQHATVENCRNCDFRPICGNGVLKLTERKTGDERLGAFQHIKETVA